eukprot:scaffold9442_cov117-Isochrysis_galbana.AAC.3
MQVGNESAIETKLNKKPLTSEFARREGPRVAVDGVLARPLAQHRLEQRLAVALVLDEAAHYAVAERRARRIGKLLQLFAQHEWVLDGFAVCARVKLSGELLGLLVPLAGLQFGEHKHRIKIQDMARFAPSSVHLLNNVHLEHVDGHRIGRAERVVDQAVERGLVIEEQQPPAERRHRCQPLEGVGGAVLDTGLGPGYLDVQRGIKSSG